MANPIEVYLSYKFVRMMGTPFSEWDAYKLGLIDEKGNTIKKATTREEEDAFGAFARMVRNLKRLLAKVPGRSTKLASYAAALWLIKEGKADGAEIVLEGVVDQKRLSESTFNQTLASGTYQMKHKDDLIDGLLGEGFAGMFIVSEETRPMTSIFGVPVFELRDVVSRKKVALPEEVLEKVK